MRRRSSDAASVSVLETVTVGIMVLGVVLYVAQVSEPTSDDTGAHSRVETYARDALAVLAGLPGEGDLPTKLDDLVADAYDGNTSKLKDQLDKYFPPGVAYNVYLNNGQESVPLIEDADPPGDTVTTTRLVTLVDTRFYVFSSLDLTAGASEVDKLDFYVIPLKNRYYYPYEAVEIVFENGVSLAPSVNDSRDYLTVEDVTPELPWNLTGYETHYDTTDNVTFAASIAAAELELPHRFTVGTTTDHPVSGHAYYDVEPTFTTQSVLMERFVEAGNTQINEESRNQQRGNKVRMHYNYQSGYDILDEAGWTVTDKTMRIYSPVDGTVLTEQAIPALTGVLNYMVPADAAFGTYVVEWEFELAQADTLDVDTGLVGVNTITQVAREIDMFHVTASPAIAPLPPVYRLEVVAWLEGA